MMSYAIRVLKIQLTYLEFIQHYSPGLEQVLIVKHGSNCRILPDKEPHAGRAQCYYLCSRTGPRCFRFVTPVLVGF